jgi:uncharacterized LabA/DUF88 family protein
MKGSTIVSPTGEIKVALLIDGAQLSAAATRLAFEVDYQRLLKEFQTRGTLLRANYYRSIADDREYSSLRPLMDWLDFNGYSVVTKAIKEVTEGGRHRTSRSSINVELAADAIELSKHVDEIVLFSGDGHLRPLVEVLQRRGVRVTVVSTISGQRPIIADELRKQADEFIDLAALRTRLGRFSE